MEIGDLVKCKIDYKKDQPIRVCFVEEVISEGDWRNKGKQVSLYATDGEYIGDYWEDELQPLGKKIPADTLQKLIREAVKNEKWGLVADWGTVLRALRK